MARLACVAALAALLPLAARGAPLAEAESPPRPTPPSDVVPAPDEPPGPPAVQFVTQLSADFGKTWVVKVDSIDTGTGEISTETLYLNSGFGLSVGAAFLPLLDGRLTTQATVGFEAWQVGASDGAVTWLAYPIEVMEFLTAGPVRVGVGLSYLVSPRVKGKELLAPIQIEFDNSAGMIAELDWTTAAETSPRRTRLWFGLRYEVQRLTDQYDQKWNADAWGIVAGAAF